MQLKASKCHKEVTFLSPVVSRDALLCDPANIEVVAAAGVFRSLLCRFYQVLLCFVVVFRVVCALWR